MGNKYSGGAALAVVVIAVLIIIGLVLAVLKIFTKDPPENISGTYVPISFEPSIPNEPEMIASFTGVGQKIVVKRGSAITTVEMSSSLIQPPIITTFNSADIIKDSTALSIEDMSGGNVYIIVGDDTVEMGKIKLGVKSEGILHRRQ